MDSADFNTDEQVLATNTKIIMGGVRHVAELTEKRILLRDPSGMLVENILFTSLRSIRAGENTLHEPTLTLTVTADVEETRSVELIYPRQPGGLNIQDRDKSLEFMKNHGIPVSASQKNPLVDETSRLTAQEWMPASHLDNVVEVRPEIPGSKRSLFPAIAAILIILAVIAGIALIYKPAGTTNSTMIPKNVTSVPIVEKQEATPVPLPTAEAQEPLTPPVPAATSGVGIPQTGVWVRVTYTGNYSGSIGYLGYQTPINSSGDHIYQVSISSGEVTGSIEKQDGSGNNLEVTIYKDGAIVSRLNTAVPHGVIYMKVPV